jgi:hypothetical protein
VNRTLINFVAFQAGWFSCVLSAAAGVPLFGLLAVAIVVSLHLKLASRPQPELKLIVIAVLLGLVFDSLIVSNGWIRYPTGIFAAGIAPYWILGMWALFATTLNASMKWMKGKVVLASVMGAVFGPLSYVAGARLGGLEFVEYTTALIALAVIWAIAMPILVVLAGRFDGFGTVAPAMGLRTADGKG